MSDFNFEEQFEEFGPDGGDHPGSAADALDSIRDGGARLITLSLERTEQLKTALGEGRFQDAARHLTELEQKVRPLAFAYNQLASFGTNRALKRAGELQVGDWPLHCPRIESLEPGPAAEREGDREIVKVHFEGEDQDPIVWDISTEIIVWADQ